VAFAVVTAFDENGQENSRRVVDMKTIQYRIVRVAWSEDPMLLITTKDGSRFYIKGDLDDLVATWQDQLH
jgi:hypothetical protein